MDLLALTLPGGNSINPPSQLPKGGLTTVQTAVGNALSIMIILAIVIVVAMIVWSGIQWASSGGDKGKVAAARGRMTWAIIGLVVVLTTFFILNIIGYFFNIPLLGR